MTRLFIYLLLITSSASALADEDNWRYGLGMYATSSFVSDPFGGFSLGRGRAYSGMVMYNVNRGNRIKFNLDTEADKIDASTTVVGESVVSSSANISLQHNLRLFREFKPWVGVGLGYADTKFSDRFYLTPSGAYSVPLENRTSADMTYVLCANNEWRFSGSKWSAGIEAQYSNTFLDKSGSLRVGFYFIY